MMRNRKGGKSSTEKRDESESELEVVQQHSNSDENHSQSDDSSHKSREQKKKRRKTGPRWRCIDNCCWVIGYLSVTCWILFALYNALPGLPQKMTEAVTGPPVESPGLRLAKEGVVAKHPVVFIPGIVTGGLELWKGQACADGWMRKRVWGGSFGEVMLKNPLCWMKHMALQNETGLDIPGIKVRPATGLSAADYFAPGYFVWAMVIENLAQIGYEEEKNMYMAVYDWRLSPQNTEVRDQTLTRLKHRIESLVETNGGNKVVAVGHSMGAPYFLHFMKWVEAPKPMGGGGGKDWCARHLKAVMNIGGPWLGVSKSFTGVFSAEAKDVAVARAVAPGLLDANMFGINTLQHIMKVTRSWDSVMSMYPKGGNAVWGDEDWSPEEGYDCAIKKKPIDGQTDVNLGPHGNPYAHYGRLISFGLEAAQMPSSEIKARAETPGTPAPKEPVQANVSCGDVWTEYREISWKDIEEVTRKQVYTVDSSLDLLRKVAPKWMTRVDENWSFGLADDPTDAKYDHFKYWANPLETVLPNAPEMEIFCLHGVGLLTERSYIYKAATQSDSCRIPFRIDASAKGPSEGCLQDGAHFVDGDQTVTALSAGFMCAKGWRGKTKFNPHGSRVYLREIEHNPPANLLDGRGTQSGSHVDVMGNFDMLEDILRVASGSTGEDLGGDRHFSQIYKWAENIKI